MLAGLLILILAGVCQGSFGIGYKRYHPFSWEIFWMIYSLLCLVTSVLFTWVVAPDLWRVLSLDVPFSSLIFSTLCGALWGISAIAFSKGITLIGMSMVYGISMGISTVTGAVVPMIMNNTLPHGKSAAMFVIGLVLIILGVAIITRAGVVRDGTRKGSKFGIILAILSGLGSGAQNVGFSSAGAQNIAEAFIERGYTNISVSSGRWLPVLAGGCIMGALICMAEAIRKRNVHTMIEKGALKRSVILFGVSIVWFVALIFYGLATNMLGHLGETAGWILFNSLALVISGVLGFATGEWKNNKNARKWLFAGNGTLIVAWIFFALI